MQRRLSTLELLISQALKLDIDAQKHLIAFDGKSIRIECTQPDIDIVISVDKKNIQLLTLENWQRQERAPVTSQLTGDLSAFLKLLAADDKAAALINSELKLKGDSALLIDLQKLLANVGIDWEYHLARIVGDIPAHFLGKLSRDSWHWLRRTHPVFIQHLKEFLTEEIALTPSQEAMDEYICQVQALDQRIDRLEARIKRAMQISAKG